MAKRHIVGAKQADAKAPAKSVIRPIPGVAHRAGPEPAPECAQCPRLVDFRAENQKSSPDWFNAPVPSFGDAASRLLIVGLAPGLKGANRTGRPFTGDYAGDLLYATLLQFGFARGTYEARSDDGLELVDSMLTNAVRCVPPQNKPTPAEIACCRPYLQERISAASNLKVILVLGRIAHDQTLAALGLRKASFPFSHGALHEVGGGIKMADSFHCSRYNTNTGRLTAEMFAEVFVTIRDVLERA